MLLRIHPLNPEMRLIQKVVRVLEEDGVIVYPTDTIYALGCDAQNKRAVEKLYRASKSDKTKQMTLLCQDFAQVSTYAEVSSYAFRVMRAHFPGPYVFVLGASRQVPKLLLQKRRTIGIRIPSNPIARDLVVTFGRPLFTTSLKNEEGECQIDPEVIEEAWGNRVDLVVDGGATGAEPSTVVSLVGDEAEVLREGKGDLAYFR